MFLMVVLRSLYNNQRDKELIDEFKKGVDEKAEITGA
jgi:hypothetical protein